MKSRYLSTTKLFSLALLIFQLYAAWVQAEHLHHQDDEDCETCLLIHASGCGSAVINTQTLLLPFTTSIICFPDTAEHHSSESFQKYLIRGPPATLY